LLRAQKSSRKYSAMGTDILRPLAQRGHADGHHAHAVVQILAKLALRHQPSGRDWWRRSRARDANRLLAAHAVEFALLQHAQQLGLRVRVQIADSSRNSVPPSASSNLPRRAEVAPVNDPFSCPNSSLSISSVGIAAQFTFTNGPSANGLGVDVRGQQFLAGARFADQQHARIGARGQVACSTAR
jgi:hypothetical protein